MIGKRIKHMSVFFLIVFYNIDVVVYFVKSHEYILYYQEALF